MHPLPFFVSRTDAPVSPLKSKQCVWVTISKYVLIVYPRIAFVNRTGSLMI